MQPTGYKDFCDRWLAAWTGNDPERLLTFYTEDTYYRDPARPHGLNGRDELRKYLERLLAVYPNWVWSPVEIMPTEKGFTLKWRADIPINGQNIVEDGLDIVELRDGKISRNEVYFDPSRMG